MHPSLETLTDALDQLGDAIVSSYTQDKSMLETWGWNFPAYNRHDLAKMAKNLSETIRNADESKITDALIEELNSYHPRITYFRNNSLQYLFNGHGQTATPVYLSIINGIKASIASILTPPVPDWERVDDNSMLPPGLIRRLKSIKAELAEIVPEKDDLKKQIDLINDATTAAETLPIDLERLKEEKIKVSSLSTSAAELFGKIDKCFGDSVRFTGYIEDLKAQADKLVEQCEEAYRITTTKGLAAAFDQRAGKLSTTMWIWVAGLFVSLGIGVWLGAERFETIEASLNVTDPKWGVLWMQFVLSVIGLAAPIWFAWLATKQIAQRFRLSEDYAFKASVAKAYEGYRKEAARIDESFESRLFDSALTRLEEAPLRLVENDPHGSPWHELIDSDAFKKALDTFPDLRDKFMQLSKEGLSVVKSRIGNKKEEEVSDKTEVE